MKKTNREKIIKEWLIEDTKEMLVRARKDLTYEEIVLLLSDSLEDVFLDIVDHKEIDIDKLPKRRKIKREKITTEFFDNKCNKKSSQSSYIKDK
jgi:hypothetical protein